jgi:hypothetical protein
MNRERPDKITLARGEPTWRAVIDLYQAKGLSRADAIKWVIIEWLTKGETEPLLWATGDSGEITDPVLRTIALMLTPDPSLPYYLSLHRQPEQLGAPEKSSRQWRDMFIAVAYERWRVAVSANALAYRNRYDHGRGPIPRQCSRARSCAMAQAGQR